MRTNSARRLLVASSLVTAFASAAAASTTGGFDGGSTVALRGLPISTAITANLSLANLAAEPSRCSFALLANGQPVGPAVSLTLGPHEERALLDAFEGQSADDFAAGEAVVSCVRPFRSLAVLADREGSPFGEIEGDAAEPYEKALAGDPSKAAAPCTVGAQCFDADGTVHEPTKEKPVGRVTFPAPAGVASRFVAAVDVTVGPWFEKEPSGKHLIYWFVVDKNFDMPGLLYFRGPNKNQAFARHGVGLTHPQKIKVIKPFAAEVGHTYHVVEDYDMAGKRMTITITEKATGQVVVTLPGRPNVASFNVKAGQKFLFDMAFPEGKVPTEVPAYGWKFANVHVEAFVH